MKTSMHYIYVTLSVVSICGATFFLPLQLTARLILGCVIIMSALISIVLLNRHNRAEAKQAKVTEAEIATLKATLHKSEELRAKFREAVVEMSNDLENAKHVKHDGRAEQYLDAFHENYVKPYLDYLMSVEMPLSSEAKQKIVNDTVELAMLAIDMADAYDWDINNREEQRIVCGLLLRHISKEDAMDQATKITDNPFETPKWVRALNDSLKDVISDGANIILSGYKA